RRVRLLTNRGCRRLERATSHRPPPTRACYRLRGPDTSPPRIQLAVTHVFDNGRSEQDARVARSQIPPRADIAEENRDKRPEMIVSPLCAAQATLKRRELRMYSTMLIPALHASALHPALSLSITIGAGCAAGRNTPRTAAVLR